MKLERIFCQKYTENSKEVTKKKNFYRNTQKYHGRCPTYLKVSQTILYYSIIIDIYNYDPKSFKNTI